jgi:hypothetical protein
MASSVGGAIPFDSGPSRGWPLKATTQYHFQWTKEDHYAVSVLPSNKLESLVRFAEPIIWVSRVSRPVVPTRIAYLQVGYWQMLRCHSAAPFLVRKKIERGLTPISQLNKRYCENVVECFWRKRLQNQHFWPLDPSFERMWGGVAGKHTWSSMAHAGPLAFYIESHRQSQSICGKLVPLKLAVKSVDFTLQQITRSFKRPGYVDCFFFCFIPKIMPEDTVLLQNMQCNWLTIDLSNSLYWRQVLLQLSGPTAYILLKRLRFK